MSLSRAWKRVRGVVAPAVGMMVGGPFGAVLGGVLAGSSQPRVPATVMPGAGAMTMWNGVPAKRELPRTFDVPAQRATPAAAPLVLRGGAMAIRRIAQSAATYCRKHPQWCATVGGIAAVEGMIRGGQLPVIKRRRRKGITARELSSFRRVSSILNKWCKVPQPTRPRRRACR